MGEGREIFDRVRLRFNRMVGRGRGLDLDRGRELDRRLRLDRRLGGGNGMVGRRVDHRGGRVGRGREECDIDPRLDRRLGRRLHGRLDRRLGRGGNGHCWVDGWYGRVIMVVLLIL